MNNLRHTLALAALVSFAGISVAAAAPVTPGDYKLVVSHGTPCTVTLSADGSASAGACPNANVSHWRQTGSTLELDQGGNGTIFALFHASADGYAGRTAAMNSTATLTPTTETAAAH